MELELPVLRQGDRAGGIVPRCDDARQALHTTLAFVLAGGRGSRLMQLTDWRAKPAVLLGSRHRIIDFTLANCVNSGLRRIAVPTQYKAQSLIRHLQECWQLNRRLGEFVEILPAQQGAGQGWYAGTADAVYQSLDLVRRLRPSQVIVLSGDHVYKMDYSVMLAEHVARRSDVTVGCVEVPLAEASAFGVLQTDEHERIVGWEEKPRSPKPMPGSDDRALVSMGIYVFDAQTLVQALNEDAGDSRSTHDFGYDVLPGLLRSGSRVHAHPFSRSCVRTPGNAPYWRDVGTLDAYWQVNVELADGSAGCDLFDRRWPIPSADDSGRPSRFLSGSRGEQSVLTDSLIGNGCVIDAATIRRSVLFSDLRIGRGAFVEESIVLSETVVGAGARLRRVVVDKHCRLPPGLEVGFDHALDRQRFHVTDRGITLITPAMLGQRSPVAGLRDRRLADRPA